MKRILIVLFILALTACGSAIENTSNTSNTSTIPMAATSAKLMVTGSDPVYGLDFWIYTQDTTTPEFQKDCYGAARYDTVEQGWHINVVSVHPMTVLPVVNLPQTYSLRIILAIDYNGQPVQVEVGEM